MGELDVTHSESADLPSAWTPKVRRLLQDWEERADAAAKTHYVVANHLTSKNYLLGVPVVVLTAFVSAASPEMPDRGWAHNLLKELERDQVAELSLDRHKEQL